MRYYVLAEDGNKYGPADPAMLNQCIEEGRLLPEMMLEEDGSRHRVQAASISELEFYDKEAEPAVYDGGAATAVLSEPPVESNQNDLILGWAMVAATLVFAAVPSAPGFIGVFTMLLGVISGLRAKERGSPSAGGLIVILMLSLVIWIAARVIYSLR